MTCLARHIRIVLPHLVKRIQSAGPLSTTYESISFFAHIAYTNPFQRVTMISMRWFIRHFLSLLLFSLLINAGGIALAKTYPRLHLGDSQQSDIPLKKNQRPFKGNIASSDPVAFVDLAGSFQQLSSPGVCQYCTEIIATSRKAGSSPRFVPVHYSITQYYPGQLSPPPRLLASI